MDERAQKLHNALLELHAMKAERTHLNDLRTELHHTIEAANKSVGGAAAELKARFHATQAAADKAQFTSHIMSLGQYRSIDANDPSVNDPIDHVQVMVSSSVAAPGDIISFRPGVYVGENVVFEESLLTPASDRVGLLGEPSIGDLGVTIQGVESDRSLVCIERTAEGDEESPVITIRGDRKVVIRNMTIRQVRGIGAAAIRVEGPGATLVIENCYVEAGNGPCIAVQAEAKCYIRRCELVETLHCGVRVHSAKAVDVFDTVFDRNLTSAVIVDGQCGSIVLKGCTIKHCAEGSSISLRAKSAGKVFIHGTTIESAGRHGLEVEVGSRWQVIVADSVFGSSKLCNCFIGGLSGFGSSSIENVQFGPADLSCLCMTLPAEASKRLIGSTVDLKALPAMIHNRFSGARQHGILLFLGIGGTAAFGADEASFSSLRASLEIGHAAAAKDKIEGSTAASEGLQSAIGQHLASTGNSFLGIDHKVRVVDHMS